jgi:uncharacterized membrane protein HdeD (DUF308 family)
MHLTYNEDLMTAQNTPARIARISVPVIIGVALLVAGVPYVVGALWVLLIAVPSLVTLRLVLSQLDAAAQDGPTRVARVMTLVTTGVALLAIGVSSAMAVWTSSFGRFMYLEDLGLAETTAAAAARDTPVDRALMASGLILALLGAAALIAAAVQSRRRGHGGR